MKELQRTTVGMIIGIIVLVPSVAHAHGFPWWFGWAVLSPFLFMAVLVAIPCKAGILRVVVLKDNQSLPFTGILTLTILDLAVLFLSLWAYTKANSQIRNCLYDMIDSSVGWSHRATFQGVYDALVGVSTGSMAVFFCAFLLWFPYYRILGKRIPDQSENDSFGKYRRLFWWSPVLASIGPALFWLPVSLRWM